MKTNKSTAPLNEVLRNADAAMIAKRKEEGAFDSGPLIPDEEDAPLEEFGNTDLAQSRAEGMSPEMRQAIFGEDEPEREVAPPTPQPMAEDEPSPVELASLLAVQFGPTNEFSERRIARLRDEQEEIRREVLAIDRQIEHLNARRTNAMLAFSGVSADLTALGVHD